MKGECLQVRAVPSSAEEGWLRDQEKSRSHISRADGVVLVKRFLDQHHPVRSIRGGCASSS
jgi:hypothetical protein